MKNIKKNRYGKDVVNINLTVPVKLLNDFDVIAEFVDLPRTRVIISAMRCFADTVSYDDINKNFAHNSLNRIYREEHK